MRITESKLRRIIRSVIVESDDGADFASSSWRYGDYRNDEVKPIDTLCKVYREVFGSYNSASDLVEHMESKYRIETNDITDVRVVGKNIYFSDPRGEYVIRRDENTVLTLVKLP